ncbi:hypothetical protein BD779DRAFT_541305 [Infundibulicybe gibba]|nr:hypothetical protein BD779DRAFT_541305 [Infundibulicybe gibba]
MGLMSDSGKYPSGGYNVTYDPEVRERSGPSASDHNLNSHLHSPANLPAPPMKPQRPQDYPLFHTNGWVEHLLPDESLYYTHQAYQVVTDVDLSNEKLLDVVMAYLGHHGDAILPQQELWLRDTGPREGGFNPLRLLVDHKKRTVVFNSSCDAKNDSERHPVYHGNGDDRLDAKYRYWSFMEAHPAHAPLPLDAYQDAIDALSWASTDWLTVCSHWVPAPFTQEECQGLTAFLQSADKQGETPLRTHAVSKILLRVGAHIETQNLPLSVETLIVCWRQTNFRPEKPLPADAGRCGLYREDHSISICSGSLVLTTVVYACVATVIALCPLSQTCVRIVVVGVLLFFLFFVTSNVAAIAQLKADNGSIAPHAGRGVSRYGVEWCGK